MKAKTKELKDGRKGRKFSVIYQLKSFNKTCPIVLPAISGDIKEWQKNEKERKPFSAHPKLSKL